MTMRKTMRIRLDQQLEYFNSLNFQTDNEDKIDKANKKLEFIKAEFNEIDIIWNLMIVVMGNYEMERFEIEKYRLYWQNISKFWKEEILNQNEVLGFFQYLINFCTISS